MDDELARLRRLNEAQGNALIALHMVCVCGPRDDTFDDLRLAQDDVHIVARMYSALVEIRDEYMGHCTWDEAHYDGAGPFTCAERGDKEPCAYCIAAGVIGPKKVAPVTTENAPR